MSATQAIIVGLVYLFVKLTFYTARWHVERHDEVEEYIKKGGGLIFVFWHGRLLIPGFFSPKHRAAAGVISSHRDGVLISKFLAKMGIDTIYGSSSKGGRGAIKEIFARLDRGDMIVITPDGPRGPRMRLGGNVLSIAQKKQVPIIPVSWSMNRCKIFSSWDRFMLGMPFAKGAFLFGKPVWVKKEIDTQAIKKAGSELEKRLNKLTKQADEMMGVQPVEPA